MKHRTLRGSVRYLGDETGVRGAEHYLITVHRDGSRTIRARCEIEDAALLRDVVYSVDRHFAPIDAYIRLAQHDEFLGAGWFRFSDTSAEAEVITADSGRISQRLDLGRRAASFGPHPVICDAWHLARYAPHGPRRQTMTGALLSSPLPNGASGPSLSPITFDIEHLGEERITVPAGTYVTQHFQYLFAQDPPDHIWVTPDDWQMIRIRWDLLQTTYELSEQNGTRKEGP